MSTPFLLGVSLHEGVFALDGRHRLDRMGPADRLLAGLGETEVEDFARLDEFLHRTRHVFDGHVRVDPVLIEEVDAVGPETLERRLDHLLDVLRLAVEPARFEVEAELGGDDHLVADGRQGLADQLLVRVGP